MRRRLDHGLRCFALGSLVALAACQYTPRPTPAVGDPIPVNGVGYLVFNAPIVPASRDQFVLDIDKLRAAGATEVDIGMNSPGGDINAAQAMVDYMVRVHGENGITFKAYNIGLVASAATYVFLNAQDRYSTSRSMFLFHAAGAISSGPVNAQNLRDEADKLDAYERLVRTALKARTKLTDAETQTYVRRTVVLSADDARRDGIVDAIATFAVPNGARGWLIAAKPPAAPAPAHQASPSPTPSG